MTESVAISVLMPVHNGMPYLPETVASVLGQTFRNFELLAIDDGSTDATADYLRSLDDPRVRYHRLNKVGLVTALNYGIEQASAPLIARIDADDVALPSRLERQYAYMRDHPECVLLGCDFDEIDPHGRVIGENDFKMTTDVALRWQMLFATPFLHPGVVFRKEQAQQIGGYRKTYDVAEDYDMWVRLAALGEIASLPDRLMRKRMHPTAVSIVHKQRGLAQSSQIAKEYARQLSGDFDPVAAGELYWFHAVGRKPERCTMRQLVKTFQVARSLFGTGSRGGCPDLAKAIQATEEELRRRCLRHLRREWYRPGRALRWLRAMRGFDPKRGRLRDLFVRFLRNRLGRGNPGALSQAPAAAH
jgi:hypothetical protein